MTTIIYRDGVMIGDGRESMGGDEGESAMIIRDDCVKAIKLKDGRLFGGSKTSEDIERLYRSIVAGKKPPKCEDVNAMLIELDGTILNYEGHIWQKITLPFYAVGSGAIYAFPLLKAGLPLRKVIEIVLTLDPFSGGLITEVELGRKGKGKRNAR